MYAPGFPQPPNADYDAYHTYIDESLPPESPYLYGLHPNAEIGFLTTTSESLFRTVLEMQPRDSAAAGSGAASREEKVRGTLNYYIPLYLKSRYTQYIVSTCILDNYDYVDVHPYTCICMCTCTYILYTMYTIH